MDSDTLKHIENVLKDNRRGEIWFGVMATILFLTGIAGVIAAMITGEYFWSIHSAAVSAIIIWPLKQIRFMRSENIVISVAPALIEKLPDDVAVRELQKLLERLYGR